MASCGSLATEIIPLDDTIDLTDRNVIQRILSGKSVGFSAYFGVGGGLSVPKGSDYEGRVVILKQGLGGVMSITSSSGSTIGPPADSE